MNDFHKIGVRGRTRPLILGFLSGRTQDVVVKERLSDIMPVTRFSPAHVFYYTTQMIFRMALNPCTVCLFPDDTAV